jgi:hypothetical protein
MLGDVRVAWVWFFGGNCFGVKFRTVPGERAKREFSPSRMIASVFLRTNLVEREHGSEAPDAEARMKVSSVFLDDNEYER